MISVRFRTVCKRAGVVFFCYFVFVQSFFIFHPLHGVARSLSPLLVVPAASVQTKHLSYRELASLAQGMKGFAGAERNREAFDLSLRTSVTRLYIEQLADELDVSVDKDEVAAYPIDSAAITPGLELAKWDEDDYRKYIVKPLLLAQKIEAALGASEAYQAEPLATMESLRKKLAQGMPFTEVAVHFSEDASAEFRGDLGIMSMRHVPDWLLSSTTLLPGQISGVIESPAAFWTVEMIEVFPSEIPENAAVHFRGFAVKKNTLGAVMDERALSYPAFVFVW
jgi:hypothetical protein